MTWSAIAVAFLVSHLAGDFLAQTEWQASHKSGGLGRDRVARRALLAHGTTYTLAFVPALVWIGVERGALVAVGVAALISLPHVAVDDGRFTATWLRRVKHVPEAPAALAAAVDQSFHAVALLVVALLAAS